MVCPKSGASLRAQPQNICESKHLAGGISLAMIQDFRFAFRQLIKAPGFTAIAILTLAIAIGVNSAIFALVNGVILKPVVPLRPAEVVNVFTARQGAAHDYRPFTYNEFSVLRERNDLFAEVAAMQFAVAGIGRDEGMRRSFVFLSSSNFFSLMGVKPAIGRFYDEAECRPDASIPVVVASYPYWKKLGGRADLIGKPLTMNGESYTLIGVTPEGFSGVSALLAPDLWLPLGVYSRLGSAFSDTSGKLPLTSPKNYTLNLVARMQPGLTIEATKARLPALAKRLSAVQPPDSTGLRELQIQSPSRFSISTTPSDDGPMGLIGIMLVAMAAAVLLIACLNLANMLLARGANRAKEIALRLALGASRWRIVRQLLCEGFLLAFLGGALGLLISYWSNDFLLGSLGNLFGSLNFSIVVALRPDLIVLSITFLICLIATMLFSLGPALKASRADLVNDLKQQVGEPAHVGRLNRFFAPRHLLVMVQIALSLTLLFSAGLFFRGALKAGALNPGFDRAGAVSAEMDFTLGREDEDAARRTMFAAVHRVRTLPGVKAAALTTMLPYGNITNARRVMRLDDAVVAKTDPNAPEAGAGGIFTAVTPGWFDAIGVRLLRGRDFTETETERKDSPPVLIIDEVMAKKLFPKGDALGQHLRYTTPPSDGSANDFTIVGIVSPHRHEVLGNEMPRRIFAPFAQAYSGGVVLQVRLARDDRAAVSAMIPTLRQTLREVDPAMPILRIDPFEDIVDKNVGLWAIRFGAVLFGIFGGVALLLAVVGVYGVKAYSVARRTREIGIRMALGADRGDVFALIMRQGALQTAFALGVGLLLALGLGRVLAKMLYEVSPSDPVALIASSVMLGAAALLACFLPARRAMRVTPMTALRME
ncbi:MAG: ABC transporter permease [Verrucomicrobiota bacterium]|nr:ABC transporter permease [Verrucomicrobiota bacterium]